MATDSNKDKDKDGSDNPPQSGQGDSKTANQTTPPKPRGLMLGSKAECFFDSQSGVMITKGQVVPCPATMTEPIKQALRAGGIKSTELSKKKT